MMRPIQTNNGERASLNALRSLHGKKKLQYIWDYYKLPLVILGIFLYVIIYAAYRSLTYKEPVLYTALVNVNAGESLTEQLDKGFLDVMDIDSAQNRLYLYSGLYLTDDENNAYHEYTYASRMKILAAIDGELLDVVLMDKEAFDAFAQNGYLCDIDELLRTEAPGLYEDMKPFIVENIFIAEDNSFELQFDPSVSYSAVTEEYPMGLDISQTGLIERAGFQETVYLGIIANSPRRDTALAYLQYLFYGK
ncbi:MAG: hypothetical protein NC341_11815 [Blautia sp.]|nr:hypothetical protein [Blautia sp.]MCM1202252.1 hypothetical protein [Bacteroides fragilis]